MDRIRTLSLVGAVGALAAVALTPAGAAAQAPGCKPAGNIEAIIDDSGSMSFNDSNELRRTGMELFIKTPANGNRTLGAAAFGSDASTVFAPGPIGGSSGSMIAALNGAINADDGATDYNAAFARATADNPNAQARIFLTDGEHTDFPAYANGHRGGPPTYVVGLGIGAAGQGQAAADLLQQVASETGGRYFPQVDAARLQPTFNTITSLVGCLPLPKTVTTGTFTQEGQRRSKAVGIGKATRNVDLVLNWADPDNRFKAIALSALGKNGRLLATLTGKGDPAKLKVKIARSDTFQAITLRKPKGTRKLRFVIRALDLQIAERVVAQLTQRR